MVFVGVSEARREREEKERVKKEREEEFIQNKICDLFRGDE